MPHITIGETQFTCPDDVSLLDSLLANKIDIPYGCRQGICQACLMQSMDSPPPVSSQLSLKDVLQRQNYFLACRCFPQHDMTVALPGQQGKAVTAIAIAKHYLAPDILRLTLQCNQPVAFYPGQFINLQRDDGLVRSYSIANQPNQDNILEFHIRRLPHGQFSTWLHEGLDIGGQLLLSKAQGNCHYMPGQPRQPLLLIGTGCGLAPLYGIVNAAIQQGHLGPIELFHGSRSPEGLYLVDELHDLAERHSNFHYTPCLSGKTDDKAYAQGRVHELALADKSKLQNWRIYVSGHPDMIEQSQKMAYLKGASLKDIYADAFTVGPTSWPCH